MNNKLSDVYEDTYKIPFDYEIPKDKEVFPRAPPDELVFKLIWNTYQHTSFVYENSVNVTLLPFDSDRRFATHLTRSYAHLEERSLYQGFLTTLLVQALSNYI
ncbi:unnamed protein product [Pocillopora meandrina]|uniref:Uncharacterized protein n=1 Tax=Pocillopora meandrina TaxID=46732 RepID=A0AAU9VJZ9_9CNID|nr:unnamed protein product [Pocillopora meandrina]